MSQLRRASIDGLIVVPPTVGHVNHGLALASLLEDVGYRTVVLTGSRVRSHVVRLGELGRVSLLQSLDFNTDRASPGYRPHLKQLCGSDSIFRQVKEILSRHLRSGARFLVGKDYPAARFAAMLMGIPYFAYYTDGAAGLSQLTNAQSTDLDDLHGIWDAADMLSLDVGAESVGEFLKSDSLNLVRGYAVTSGHGEEADAPGGEAAQVWLGATVYVGGDTILDVEVERFTREYRGQLLYVTFGTVSAQAWRLEVLDGVLRELSIPSIVSHGSARSVTGSRRDLIVHTGYVTQSVAMSAASAVLHHGGHGTTLEALGAGVPQLVLPENPRTNQRSHGLMLERLGVGRLLTKQDLGVQGFREAWSFAIAPHTRLSASALSGELALLDEGVRPQLETAVKQVVG